jgi:hypothetical protein
MGRILSALNMTDSMTEQNIYCQSSCQVVKAHTHILPCRGETYGAIYSQDIWDERFGNSLKVNWKLEQRSRTPELRLQSHLLFHHPNSSYGVFIHGLARYVWFTQVVNPVCQRNGYIGGRVRR